MARRVWSLARVPTPSPGTTLLLDIDETVLVRGGAQLTDAAHVRRLLTAAAHVAFITSRCRKSRHTRQRRSRTVSQLGAVGIHASEDHIVYTSGSTAKGTFVRELLKHRRLRGPVVFIDNDAACAADVVLHAPARVRVFHYDRHAAAQPAPRGRGVATTLDPGVVLAPLPMAFM